MWVLVNSTSPSVAGLLLLRWAAGLLESWQYGPCTQCPEPLAALMNWIKELWWHRGIWVWCRGSSGVEWHKVMSKAGRKELIFTDIYSISLVSESFFHFYAAIVEICYFDRDNYLMTSLFMCLFQNWSNKPVIAAETVQNHPDGWVAGCRATVYRYTLRVPSWQG